MGMTCKIKVITTNKKARTPYVWLWRPCRVFSAMKKENSMSIDCDPC
jgi:hypothetical protein